MSRAYRDDPEWQAAFAEYIADQREGETYVDLFVRRQMGAVRLYDIEMKFPKDGAA